MGRNEFIIKKIIVNGRSVRRIVVDDHFKKHKEITDDLILDLVRQLDGTDNIPDDTKDEFEYFVNLIVIGNKKYRLVWLLEKEKLFIGVITAFRDSRRKKQ